MENRLELFEKTYNTLVTAWHNGGLAHMDCRACAVGNICGGNVLWHNALHFPEELSHEESMSAAFLIKSTGYSRAELTRIEDAFEGAVPRGMVFPPTGKELYYEYIGLCAVMNVLWEIHGIQDRSLTTLNAVASDKGVTLNA